MIQLDVIIDTIQHAIHQVLCAATVQPFQLLGFWMGSILRIAKSSSGGSDILFDISQDW